MLTGLIGNGLALLIAGLALLIAKFRQHVPGSGRGGAIVEEVLLTVAVLGMLIAGDLTASTGLGSWISSVIRAGEHMLGRAGVVVAALITVFVLLTTAKHVFRSAGEAGMRVAFVLPLLLGVFPTGFFHSLSADIQTPAQAIASGVSAWMGV